MKTIGILGGMSWNPAPSTTASSTARCKKRLGGVHSAKLLLYSFDFAAMSELQRAGRWGDADALMAAAAANLEKAGADFLVIACNTMHCATSAMAKASSLPLLHIADPLGRAIDRAGLRRVGLIGSAYTMEQDGVIKGRLRDRYGLDVLTPRGRRRRRGQPHHL
ncbi:MAG: aspartate/glutamate racemase family protein [Rhizomicrobium sp.]